MVGLGRRQHAGRLVEDQDVGAAIERLEDLDALLQPDRQFLDDRASGSTSRPYSCSSRDQFGERALAIERFVSSASPSAPRMMFSSTVKFWTSMKCWCTMPMPSCDGVVGRVDGRPACRRRGSRR
jgi:hypothetical protein